MPQISCHDNPDENPADESVGAPVFCGGEQGEGDKLGALASYLSSYPFPPTLTMAQMSSKAMIPRRFAMQSKARHTQCRRARQSKACHSMTWNCVV
eukprot:2488856-Pyramimonas_sp.AAC.1